MNVEHSSGVYQCSRASKETGLHPIPSKITLPLDNIFSHNVLNQIFIKQLHFLDTQCSVEMW